MMQPRQQLWLCAGWRQWVWLCLSGNTLDLAGTSSELIRGQTKGEPNNQSRSTRLSHSCSCKPCFGGFLAPYHSSWLHLDQWPVSPYKSRRWVFHPQGLP